MLASYELMSYPHLFLRISLGFSFVGARQVYNFVESIINRLAMGEVEITVFVWFEGDYFVAYEPVSGVASQGATIEEALNNLREALELYMEDGYELYPIKRVMIAKVKLSVP